MRGKWIALAAVVGVALVGGLVMVRGGDETGVALAEAAERMEGESMLMRFTMGMSDSSGDYSVRGEGPWTANNSRGTLEMTITLDDEPPFDMTLRNIGRDYWFSSKQLNGILPTGKRWVHSYDRAGPATSLTPSQFAAFLADADEVGLPVRMRIWSTGDEKASMDMTVDILEYGVQVEVEPPPADTVIEESRFDRLIGG